jgi:excisionase family DNA binding protein
MAVNEDRWLSVDEICTHLGVSRDTVYKWIEKKKRNACSPYGEIVEIQKSSGGYLD